jgi:hypothetical protein
MSERGGALAELAEQLLEEGTPISPHVADPGEEQAFAAPGDRDYVIEAVREGYLLHYGDPRLLAGHDDDLALLAGDYLYALGIERLARAGDVEAVLVLADLIAASAQLHAEGRADEVPGRWDDAARAVSGRVSRS